LVCNSAKGLPAREKASVLLDQKSPTVAIDVVCYKYSVFPIMNRFISPAANAP